MAMSHQRRLPRTPVALGPMSAILAALPLLATASNGQASPFVDGELIVRVQDIAPDSIYRIDPLTGVGTPLVQDLFAGYGGPGSMVYDPYRDGVVVYTSYVPWGVFEPRLLLVRADGFLTDLGFAGEDITSMAPVGDGRIYLRRAGTLSVLDPDNTLSVVPDSLGQPVTMGLEHMVYDSATNSLIGVARGNSTALPCDGSGVVSVHRLPLSALGRELSGTPDCMSLVTQALSPIGFDVFDDGTLLLSFGDRSQSGEREHYRIDPTNMTASLWGTSSPSDIDGIVWSQTLQRVVLLDDWANVLRTYGQGQQGEGQVLATSIPVGGQTTGVSTTNRMIDVNRPPTACPGEVSAYGTGLAGTGGQVPSLGAASCPALGAPLTLTVTEGVGQGNGWMVFGTAQAATPIVGGTLLVATPFSATRAFLLDGFPGQAGAGFAQVELTLPNSISLLGVPFYAQAAIKDSGGPAGWALTQGLEMVAN